MKGHPVAVMIITTLIDKGAETHDYSVSTNVLAATLCCGPTLVKKELKTLLAREWITKTRSNGSASWYSLTGKYLSYLETKVEVSEDAKRFSLWFRRELQQKQWTLVHKYNQRRADDPKREHSRMLNAARILDLCETIDRAKEMSTCAVALHSKQAIQSLYNLLGIITQKSFSAEFDEWAKNPSMPVAPTPSPIASPSKAPKENEQAKLDRLVAVQKQAYSILNARRPFVAGTGLTDLEQAAHAANDAAAHQAMKMGIPPDEFVFKGVWDGRKYQEIWKSQYEKGAQQ